MPIVDEDFTLCDRTNKRRNKESVPTRPHPLECAVLARKIYHSTGGESMKKSLFSLQYRGFFHSFGREDYAHRENTYESLRTALPDE